MLRNLALKNKLGCSWSILSFRQAKWTQNQGLWHFRFKAKLFLCSHWKRKKNVHCKCCRIGRLPSSIRCATSTPGLQLTQPTQPCNFFVCKGIVQINKLRKLGVPNPIGSSDSKSNDELRLPIWSNSKSDDKFRFQFKVDVHYKQAIFK